jgi:hypothetical protein
MNPYYIHSTNGIEEDECGTSASPCKTIKYLTEID